jgi:hypothetical protein
VAGAMYRVCHCVPVSDWNLNRHPDCYRETPYVLQVPEVDCSALVEYSVIDRVIFSDEVYDSIRSQLIHGSLIRVADVLSEEDTAIILESSSIVASNFPLLPEITSGQSQSQSQSQSQQVQSELIKSESSDSLITHDNAVSSGGESNLLLELLFEDVGKCKSGDECEYSALGLDCSGLQTKSKSPSTDWKVITYTIIDDNETEGDTFMTALSIAAKIRCMHSETENTRLRRLKTDTKRLFCARLEFMEQYGLVPSTNHRDVRERLESNGKVVIMLDYNLSQIGEPVTSIRRGLTLADLVVVIRHYNGRWYPASRKVIKRVVRKISVVL